MYQKIIDREKRKRDDNLKIELSNGQKQAIYNKDLYNGVVQMQQDNRSRYEIEQDLLMQESIAQKNLVKLFEGDNKEIGKALTDLKKEGEKYIIIFNKFFGQIYRDLNGIYNLTAKDFKNYYDRFFDKITTTQGIDMPAQESTLKNVQENIEALKEETQYANEEMQNTMIKALDINSLDISKTKKNYIEYISQIKDIYDKETDPITKDALKDDMEKLGLDDDFYNIKLPNLSNPSITAAEKQEVLNIIDNCKKTVMKKLFQKYGSNITTAAAKTIYNEGYEFNHNGEDVIVFDRLLYKKDTSGITFENTPSYRIDNSDNIKPLRKSTTYKPNQKVDDYNLVINPPAAISAPVSASTPSVVYNDGDILEISGDEYLVYDFKLYPKDTSTNLFFTKPTHSIDKKTFVITELSKNSKRKKVNPNVEMYNASITAPPAPVILPSSPTITGVGLKKSVDTNKIMKILKNLQMKKITSGGYINSIRPMESQRLDSSKIKQIIKRK